MKNIALIVCLFISCVADGCIQDDDFCTAPQLITTDQNCYSGNGLVLRAGDYGKTSGDFEWELYALKDSSEVNGFSSKDLKIRASLSNQLTVPDSIAKTYQKLIVMVATNCQGTLKQSEYHAFIKTIPTSSCTKWVNQIP